ncbi:aminodeoxychorismate synthase component I [Virgibacillus siamensis]|uniref:aminodeoxychorismate synthase component I n=1 Tax=Virgibacillus siamensis TaxID=480071 RepID=UPI00098522A2|nr:aminodeoxychorismate synthase component I [Virgibacillus siamensis]
MGTAGKPYLSFEFADQDGNKSPKTFQNPQQIITTDTIREVLPCLEQVRSAVNEGYYAAGFVSYEAAPAFDKAHKVHSESEMPLLWFGIFTEPTNEVIQGNEFFQTTEWEPSVSAHDYKTNIEKIKQYIEAGDTYQVNYTIRLNAQFTGDSMACFRQLANAQEADYAAYINTGEHTIMSASPELFFRLKNGKVTTRPMKGTVNRGKTFEKDALNADWLINSEKNRAENVMIVDLLRNDLGTVAKTGTVTVPKLFTIEQYPTIYQMTSTVTAETDKTIVDIFKALFPCGSITGAPKISTMNIIHELESAPRNVYCGAIGYITPNNQAVFNVPIRTVMLNNKTGKAVYGAGGGITWDSTADEEYEEVRTKTKVLKTTHTPFKLLETLGIIDGKYIVLGEHLTRLQQTAAYFDFDVDISVVRKCLLQVARDNNTGCHTVRLLVQNDGSFSTDVKRSITEMTLPATIGLAKEPINKEDIFLYHKTTNRAVYHYFQKQHPDKFDVLLWNKDNELTEFTIGNLVVEFNGNLYTPPVECGLLPGTFRQKLLEEEKITERKIHLNELKSCTRIWLINSVRQWVEVRLKY